MMRPDSTTMDTAPRLRSWRSLPWLAALLMTCGAPAAFAQQQAEVDPPARVAHVSDRQGSVVFAPEGEDEWTELPQNRPLTTGDRLWTDSGARAEVHLGSATLHVDGESHVGVSALDDRAAQFILMQGTVNARVRELAGGENFEIDTPHLALRASQPGDYRVEVDPAGGATHVFVRSGLASVFGEGGQSVNVGAGQQASFAGRALAAVQSPPWRQDDFSQWAAQRNSAEDQSIAARHVPRGVVGYQQLDAHGTWSQDASLGAVWYPNVTVADWAPYRHGHWNWVDPWGWTWIDDAPWGFAPFHYGRWAMVESRWAWVPGRLAHRPVYAPALVAFMGGDGVNLGLGSGPGIGWFPLAPGEPWYPSFRSTPRYLGFVNFNINLGRYPRHFDGHRHRRHQHAVTVVREDDFRRGRNVREGWRRMPPSAFNQVRPGVVPARPDFRDRRGDRDNRDNRFVQRMQRQPPNAGGDRGATFRHVLPAQREQRRDDDGQRWQRERERERERDARQQRDRFDRDNAVREQARAQREQQQLQREAQREAREQQREARQERRRDERMGQPFQRSQPQMQRPRQEAAPIGQRPERAERGERGGRGGDRGMDRGGRGQRGDDGPGRGRGGRD